MIIGIDHGYGYIKTRNTIFAAGVATFESQPPINKKVIGFNNKFYQVGCAPDGLAGDKTINDDYYILTLAAIAEELKFQNITESDVILAVGIPLTRFGSEKESLISYLSKQENLTYTYEDIEYHIHLSSRIYVYPQGYSAIAPKLSDVRGSCTLVDIGTGTTEIVPISGGEHIPDLKRAHTVQFGISNCIASINEEVSRQFHSEISTEQIIDIMLKKEIMMPKKLKELCENVIASWCEDILNILRQNKVNYELSQTFFMGGGSNLLYTYCAGLDRENECVTFITDIRANAAGYELLATATEAALLKRNKKQG